ncbi:glycosyl transferase [Sporosarcina sp. P20a]|uniref:glycosyltransferase family 4 protein n=1 Tax=Sporosarcina sp. P20a TaxID=2048256 RepID=UPI000C1670BC|nr:glycosyltransferase family 4 protein [Sporosarcina sp. P20a]PIC85450.1 glycosyl transferase [Sporosarcina sp. P20a]
MKICHLTSVHPHTDTRIFIKECQSLANAGFDVHLVVPNAPNAFVKGVQIHGVLKDTGNRLKRMTKTVDNVFKKALEIDADIYHFHDPELLPIGLKLRKRGKKVIYDVHEDVPRQILTKEWLPRYTHSIISKVVELYENRAAKKMNFIITATPFIKERFLKLGCKAQDVNNYPLLDELQVKNVRWSEKENAVCYVGGITFIRGIKEMVKAIDTSKEVTLLLGGGFATSSERDIVTSLKGWSSVKELGFLNREQVKETYSKSKAGIVTLHPTINYIDALPVKMFEYMASGIPVIASNFPLWKGIIEKNNSGLCVDPLNPEEIAEAIKWIIKNPVEAERMGRNGRVAVVREYNWEAESIKLIDIYRNLMK